MKYLKTFEDVNAQDAMSIPTKISKQEIFGNVQDMENIKTNFKERGDMIDYKRRKEKSDFYTNILKKDDLNKEEFEDFANSLIKDMMNNDLKIEEINDILNNIDIDVIKQNMEIAERIRSAYHNFMDKTGVDKVVRKLN